MNIEKCRVHPLKCWLQLYIPALRAPRSAVDEIFLDIVSHFSCFNARALYQRANWRDEQYTTSFVPRFTSSPNTFTKSVIRFKAILAYAACALFWFLVAFYSGFDGTKSTSLGRCSPTERLCSCTKFSQVQDKIGAQRIHRFGKVFHRSLSLLVHCRWSSELTLTRNILFLHLLQACICSGY